MAGCTTVGQEQYFEVIGKPDPTTGKTPVAYYKMTIKGSSQFMGKYKLNAGYVSAETIDALQGNAPTIPEADLDEQNNQAIDEMKRILLKKLTSHAAAQSNYASGDPSEHEEQVIAIARQIWLASLNDPDLFSMGRMQSADPGQFRKLVFYANSKPLDLDIEAYGSQIDSLIEKTGTLSGAMRDRKKAEEAMNGQRTARQRAFLTKLVSAKTDAERLQAIVDFFSEGPSTAT